MTDPVHYDTLREALRRFDFRTPANTPGTPAWRRSLPLRTRLRMGARILILGVIVEIIVLLVCGFFLWLGLGWANEADARVPDLTYWACVFVAYGIRSVVPNSRKGTS